MKGHESSQRSFATLKPNEMEAKGSKSCLMEAQVYDFKRRAVLRKNVPRLQTELNPYPVPGSTVLA
jgi:hypothetical protein